MANVTRDAINLTAEIRKLDPKPSGPPWQMLNLGTGDGSVTDFTLPKGWKPLAAIKAGSVQVEGSGNDFTVTFDGFVYTVSFAVAPTSGNVIQAMAWRPAT